MSSNLSVLSTSRRRPKECRKCCRPRSVLGSGTPGSARYRRLRNHRFGERAGFALQDDGDGSPEQAEQQSLGSADDLVGRTTRLKT